MMSFVRCAVRVMWTSNVPMSISRTLEIASMRPFEALGGSTRAAASPASSRWGRKSGRAISA